MKIWVVLLAISYTDAFPTLEHSYSIKPSTVTSPVDDILPTSNNQSDVGHEEHFPSFISEDRWKVISVVLAFLVGMYCFIFLALICDNYFLPCIKRICEALNLTEDIAAATFMAMATSAPELFVNIVGTFIAESDIGIGTVVGSSLFNTLGVAGIGSLAAASPIQVDWWPVTRDCTIYIISVSLLVVMAWDKYIFWYEGMILFIVYFSYFVLMFNNERISQIVKKIVEKCSSVDDKTTLEKKYVEYGETTPPVIYVIDQPIQYYIETKEVQKPSLENREDCKVTNQKTFKHYCRKAWYIIIWPLKFFLRCTIPNPNEKPKLFPVTFSLCIIFIGLNSYVVSWMISIIGHIFKIPNVVLGLTFLAAGSCLPEAISITIMSRKGEGGMGVSNALGANSINILLSLGLPWFIKTMIVGGNEVNKKFIEIDSNSIEYTILGLILVAISLFLILYFNKFRLSRQIGFVLLIVYVIFLCLAISSEILLGESLVS